MTGGARFGGGARLGGGARFGGIARPGGKEGGAVVRLTGLGELAADTGVEIAAGEGGGGVGCRWALLLVVEETMPIDTLGVDGLGRGDGSGTTGVAAAAAVAAADALAAALSFLGTAGVVVELAALLTLAARLDAAAAAGVGPADNEIETAAGVGEGEACALRPGGAGRVGLGGRDARPVPGRDAHEAVRGKAEATTAIRCE